MFAFSSMQVTCLTLLYLILSVLSASYQLRFLGTFLKFISIYTFCLVEYISYLKIFLKEECLVMKTLVIWKTLYKGNENKSDQGVYFQSNECTGLSKETLNMSLYMSISKEMIDNPDRDWRYNFIYPSKFFHASSAKMWYTY